MISLYDKLFLNYHQKKNTPQTCTSIVWIQYFTQYFNNSIEFGRRYSNYQMLLSIYFLFIVFNCKLTFWNSDKISYIFKRVIFMKICKLTLKKKKWWIIYLLFEVFDHLKFKVLKWWDLKKLKKCFIFMLSIFLLFFFLIFLNA